MLTNMTANSEETPPQQMDRHPDRNPTPKRRWALAIGGAGNGVREPKPAANRRIQSAQMNTMRGACAIACHTEIQRGAPTAVRVTNDISQRRAMRPPISSERSSHMSTLWRQTIVELIWDVVRLATWGVIALDLVLIALFSLYFIALTLWHLAGYCNRTIFHAPW
jgi:hypothetical protein